MKALLVENDAKVALFIAHVLREEGWVADQCASGQEALRQAGMVEYDLVLLDWMLPDLDGLEVCRELRRRSSTVPILMLTARGEARERVLGLDAGADDYVVKPFEIDELLARIGALMRRVCSFGRLVAGDLEIDRHKRAVFLAGCLLDLTSREYALLLNMAGQEGRVVPRSEQLAQVWATNFDPGSNELDVQIRGLRGKLGAHAWMTDAVRGKGYRLLRERP